MEQPDFPIDTGSESSQNPNPYSNVDEDLITHQDEMELNTLTEEEMELLETSPDADIFTFEAPKVDDVEDDGDIVRFDFRSGLLPSGVVPVGEEQVSFEKLGDGSCCLVVPEGTSLLLDLEGLEGNQGSMVNEWSLILDMKLDSLPKNEFSLFQTCGTVDRETEGEAYVYEGGGVGVFGI